METDNDKNLEIKRQLFSHAMKGKWEEVVEIYKKNAEVHGAKITKSGDTALHLAVSDGQDDFVKQLVDTIYEADSKAKDEHGGGAVSIVEIEPKSGKEAPKALMVENERGNTPLHLAAASGSLAMCYWIAKKHPNLIFIRNNEQMNPLFLAALNGKKDAFLCLDNLCGKKALPHCRGSNGDTFLHAALNGEYFDLSFQIICRYGEALVNLYNEKGFNPLHVLATKPSSFKSGKRLGHLEGIIYYCTFVEELEEDNGEKEPKHESESEPEEKQPNLPKNYQACFFIYGLYQKVYRVIHTKKNNGQQQTNGKSKDTGNNNTHHKTDVESPDTKGCGIRNCLAVAGPKMDSLFSHCTEKEEDNKKEDPIHLHDIFPPNYKSCFEPVKLMYKAPIKLMYKAFLIILGCGLIDIKKVLDKKKQHVWTVQILNRLLSLSMTYEFENNGQKLQGHVSHLQHPEDSTDPSTPAPDQNPQRANKNNQKNEDDQPKKQTDDEQKNKTLVVGKDCIVKVVEKVVEQLLVDQTKNDDQHKIDTPILVAAKYGIIEIVEKVLEQFPVATTDINSDGKNIVLLAVENRQTVVFQFLLKRYILRDTIFHEVDKDGNSALHLAAKISDRPWLIPGLKMQWEIKWYEFIEKSIPVSFGARYNKAGETPDEIFMTEHSDLVKKDTQWLMKTSDSCVIAATLIATVAFATSASVPGGVNQDNGVPVLIQQGMFDVFSISSLAALCFSLTALIIFLAILTTQHQAMDFRRKVPGMLLIGLTTLFLSIASMLISFCGGHFFILRGVVRDAWVFEYLVALLPMTVFAMVQFPLYFNLFRAALKTAPESSYMATT
ncbi:hypothetical protein ACSBR2_032022 [Camellia fascicularis]